MTSKKDIKEYYNVPEGYFEELHNSIMAQIDDIQVTRGNDDAMEAPRRRPVFFAVAWRMAAAAAVIAVMVLSATVIFNSGETKMADSALCDTSSTVTSPDVIMGEPAPAVEKVVTVSKESIAEMPQRKEMHGQGHKAVAKKVASPVTVTAHETEDFAADRVDEYLMIDDQMLHQMMVTEM